jgi:ferritin-like metal-binding protein YciE
MEDAMAEATPLHDLFVDELKDLYNAENQLINALPRMARAANAPELQRAFEKHLSETRRQAQRLDQIGRALDVKVTGKRCKGMEGLTLGHDRVARLLQQTLANAEALRA